MKPIVLIVLIGAIAISGTNARATGPTFNSLNCSSSDDCNSGECCVLGGNRYSIPQCQPMRAEGDNCRPGSSVFINETLFYPDGSQLKIENVHFVLCPCTYGLACDISKGGTCQDPAKKHGFNDSFDGINTLD